MTSLCKNNNFVIFFHKLSILFKRRSKLITNVRVRGKISSDKISFTLEWYKTVLASKMNSNSKSDKPGPKDHYWTINIEIDYIYICILIVLSV